MASDKVQKYLWPNLPTPLPITAAPCHSFCITYTDDHLAAPARESKGISRVIADEASAREARVLRISVRDNAGDGDNEQKIAESIARFVT